MIECVHVHVPTRLALYRKDLAALALSSTGVAAADVLALLARTEVGEQLNTGNACTQELKFHVKLGRQTGIHVSPTTLLNGMICDTSSSWSLDQWMEFLDPHCATPAVAKM
jgi:protein-disulfide isomerase